MDYERARYEKCRGRLLEVVGGGTPEELASIPPQMLELVAHDYALLPPEYQMVPEVAMAGMLLEAALAAHDDPILPPLLPHSSTLPEDPGDLDELVL